MTGDGDGKWENPNPPTDGPPRVSHATFSTSSPPTPDTPGTDCHGTNPVKLITEATPPLPPPFHGATHRVPSSFGLGWELGGGILARREADLEHRRQVGGIVEAPDAEGRVVAPALDGRPRHVTRRCGCVAAAAPPAGQGRDVVTTGDRNETL